MESSAGGGATTVETVTGNELLARALNEQRVETMFFLMGGPMLGAERAILDSGIRGIDVRHEQAAAMMAHAYARVLNRPGVCVAASGPGATNLTTGIANAYVDGAPVVALGGSSPLARLGKGDFQEIDQVALFAPITKWSARVLATPRIPELVATAFHQARSGRPSPVYLDVPADVLYRSVEAATVPASGGGTGRISSPGRPLGDPELVRAAVDLLRSAERPVILSGSGVLWSGAAAQLRGMVERFGIPIYTTPQGRGVVPEDAPLTLLGARSAALREADLVLVLGTRLNYVFGFGAPPRFSETSRFIRVDIDPGEIGRGRPVDVGIVGDVGRVIEQLVEVAGDTIAPGRYAAWVGYLQSIDEDKRARSEQEMATDQLPIHPLRLCKEVRDFLDRDAILVVDGQEILNYARVSIPSFSPGHRLNSGPFGTMGVGLPFGIGAKVARPDAQVLVLHGDGSFGLNAMEVDTAVRHRVPVVTVISNNGGWTADPAGTKPGRELGFTRYDQLAQSLGGHGECVERPEQIRPALERAFRAGVPAVVNVITDPTARAPGSSFTNYAT